MRRKRNGSGTRSIQRSIILNGFIRNNSTGFREMGDAVNIRKIAELAECSPSTVSRVLAGRAGTIRISEATRERIKRVCAELDYQPSIHASRLFSGHSGVIGFLTAGKFMLEDDNLAKSFFHVCSELFRYGCRCLPLIDDKAFRENREYLNIFKRNEIDGLLVWGAREGDPFLEELRRAGYPFLGEAQTLMPGSYTVTLNASCREMPAEAPAQLQVGIKGEDGYQVIAYSPLAADGTATVQFALTEKTENVSCRVYQNDGTILEITGVDVQRS